MTLYLEPHPDLHLQHQAVKQITIGCRQEQQTEAMNAYFDVIDATGDNGKAEEAYKAVHQKHNNGYKKS